MKFEKITLQTPEGASFKIRLYSRRQFTAFPDRRQWPIAVIFPGGGFTGISEREVEPAALAFLAKGYQVVVVRYHLAVTTPFYPTAAVMGLIVLHYLRENATMFHGDPTKIVTVGFSAGGHLVAVMNALGGQPEFLKQHGFTEQRLQPLAQVLCYPVIDLRLGFPNDLKQAEKISPDQELWAAQNLVTTQTPPTFIWHTVTDELVPVINSIVYVTALAKNQVNFDSHIYSQGVHGLAFANVASSRVNHPEDIAPRAASWFELALSWLRTCFASSNQTEL